MKTTTNNFILFKNSFFRVALITVFILLIPLIAMQFTSEVNWDLIDFIIMGLLLFSFGSLFVLVSRKAPNRRLLIAIVFITIFLLIWAELAVGIFTKL